MLGSSWIGRCRRSGNEWPTSKKPRSGHIVGSEGSGRRLLSKVLVKAVKGLTEMLLDPKNIAAIEPGLDVIGVVATGFQVRNGFLEKVGAVEQFT